MDSRRRSHNKKPPRGSWQPTVPAWEKKFCKVVGSLDWEALMDMKKFVHLYDNVIKWNDSAGEEAFRSAKNRFWAKIHGLPYESQLPDPDLYIDEIDWESKIDPELLSDLECNSLVRDVNEKQETVVIFGDSLVPNQSFSSAGWDETGEIKAAAVSLNQRESPGELSRGENNETNKVMKPENHASNTWRMDEVGGPMRDTGWETGWDDSWELSCGQNNATAKAMRPEDCANNTWLWDEGGGPMRDNGWETGWDNSWVASQFDNQRVENENWKHRNLGSNETWGTWNVSQQKRGDSSRYMSRYKVSRFPGDGHHNNYSWRTGKGTKQRTDVWQ